MLFIKKAKTFRKKKHKLCPCRPGGRANVKRSDYKKKDGRASRDFYFYKSFTFKKHKHIKKKHRPASLNKKRASFAKKKKQNKISCPPCGSLNSPCGSLNSPCASLNSTGGQGELRDPQGGRHPTKKIKNLYNCADLFKISQHNYIN